MLKLFHTLNERLLQYFQQAPWYCVWDHYHQGTDLDIWEIGQHLFELWTAQNFPESRPLHSIDNSSSPGASFWKIKIYYAQTAFIKYDKLKTYKIKLYKADMADTIVIWYNEHGSGFLYFAHTFTIRRKMILIYSIFSYLLF